MVVKICTESIKLGQFLKLAGIIVNGGEAKVLVENGLVKVNGEVEKARGRKLFPGFWVEFEGEVYQVVAENAG